MKEGECQTENNGFQKRISVIKSTEKLEEPPGKNLEAMTDKREISNSITVLTHSSDQQNYKLLKNDTIKTKVCNTLFAFIFIKKVKLSNCMGISLTEKEIRYETSLKKDILKY